MRWLVGAVAVIALFGPSRAAAQEDRYESSARLVEADVADRERRSYERRRAAAHVRMPDTIYASTPSPAMAPHGVERRRDVRTTMSTDLGVSWSGFYESSASDDEETAEDLFREQISSVVQSKCINCHVEGGVSAATRLVFMRSSEADHEAANRRKFEDFLADVDNGDSVILNKVRGVGHGGGIQVAAGSREYGHMERFLTLLAGGEESTQVALTPGTLFEGVRMAPHRRTLRRAALVLAGRAPTAQEYATLRADGVRSAIRSLMTGPGFHEFLIRAANDRLLTDREDSALDANDSRPLVEYSNQTNTFCEAAAWGGEQIEWRAWEEAVQYGAVRSPLELIAHVAENDLPYTEILTADYVMANPQAAMAYGATTEFDDETDAHEFKPSRFASYYLFDDSRVIRDAAEGTDCQGYVVDPGNLPVEYPHAGILNTPVFMLRYPTTATNRNRARARWTYYHFLGLDVEQSASRTTDPVALADTDNPTLNNPACTVCHTILDPVAGTFQNYDEEGWYRSHHGGMDSLDGFYKENPPGGVDLFVEARSWDDRETVSTQGLLRAGDNTVGIKYVNEREWSQVGIDRLTVWNGRGGLVRRYRLGSLRDSHCGEPNEGYFSLNPNCILGVPVTVPTDGTYTVEVDVWNWDDDRRYPGHLRIWAPGYIYREGDTWYRGMRAPGFGSEQAPSQDNSVQWLAGKIVADDRFAESAVKFWWPAINGSDVARPPAEAGDADFEGMLLAANSQAAEVSRLARAFRRGIRGGTPYNLKDLLVEMVLSRWFRAESIPDDDPVRTVALLNAGAKRLLTPEELAHKTLALTGVQWGRYWRQPWHDWGQQRHALASEYGTLYGGIDSDGIIARARDMTAVMAGVAKSHAVEVSCPVVLREFYLLPDQQRLLFGGIDHRVTPNWEYTQVFRIAASTAEDAETLSVVRSFGAGSKTLRLTFENDFYSDVEEADRNVHLDRVVVRDVDNDSVVTTYEFEDHARGECGAAEDDHYFLWGGGSACALEVPLDIPAAGTHAIEVVAWADRAGDELPRLRVTLESDDGNSIGAVTIRKKLVDLHRKLLGVTLGVGSAEISRAYELFVDVWNRKRESESDWFTSELECDWRHDQDFLRGFLDGYRTRYRHDDGWHYNWNWDRTNAFWESRDLSDPSGVARTWTVVLMALLMDQRYLHL